MVISIASQSSFSSVNIIWCSWRFIRELLSLVLAASEATDTLRNKDSANNNNNDDTSDNNTSDSTSRDPFLDLFRSLDSRKIFCCDCQGQFVVNRAFTIKVELHHLAWLGFVVGESSGCRIFRAVFVSITVAVCVEITIDFATRNILRSKISIEKIDLILLVSDMKVEFIICFGALV